MGHGCEKLLLMAQKKGAINFKQEKKKKIISKLKSKIKIKPMQKYTGERFNKIKTRQILCHDKIRHQYGHLPATDYLGRAFPNQRYVK